MMTDFNLPITHPPVLDPLEFSRAPSSQPSATHPIHSTAVDRHFHVQVTVGDRVMGSQDDYRMNNLVRIARHLILAPATFS